MILLVCSVSLYTITSLSFRWNAFQWTRSRICFSCIDSKRKSLVTNSICSHPWVASHKNTFSGYRTKTNHEEVEVILIPFFLIYSGPRSTMNIITSTLDANFIYGSSKETADKLRRFQGGLLKTNSAHHHLGLKDLLPPKLESPDAGCVRPNKDSYCFLAGIEWKVIKLKETKQATNKYRNYRINRRHSSQSASDAHHSSHDHDARTQPHRRRIRIY